MDALAYQEVKKVILEAKTETRFTPLHIEQAVPRSDASRIRNLLEEVVTYTATYPINGRQLFDGKRGFFWMDLEEDEIEAAKKYAKLPGYTPRNPLA